MTLMTVPDLFRRCRGKETGHWRVGTESVRTVHLDSGDIVFASSTFQSDRLTTILVESGKLTNGQMEHALSNLKPGMSVGKNLIEMGFITQRDLLDAARFQVERIVWSALVAPENPTFESKDDLEDTVVRLPLDTPSLLFKGIMKIDDRESLLDLLGPLNQVVLLQGKRVFDLDLPADLAKVAPLMDGTHTILEMSSEVAVEPMRIGAFALFLREMGWGKLYELPPLDRDAIGKALTVNDQTKPPASIPPLPRSELFRTIEAAGKDTVNLGHLAKLLDDIPGPDYENESSNNPLEPMPKTESQQIINEKPLPTQTDQQNPVGRVIPMPLAEPLEEAPPQEEDPPIIINSEDSTEIPLPPTTIQADDETEEEIEAESKKKLGKEKKNEAEIETEKDSKKAEKIAERERKKAERKAEKERRKAEIESRKAEKIAERERKKAEREAEKERKKAEIESKKEVKKEPQRESQTDAKSWIRTLLYIFIAAFVVIAAVYSFREFKQFKTRDVDPPFTVIPPDSPHSEEPSTKTPETEIEKESEPKPANSPATQVDTPLPPPVNSTPIQPPQQSQVPQPSIVANAVDTSTQARFGAIADGNTDRALTQGRAFQANLPKTTWIIRLIVACQGDTLQNCAHELNTLRPELFLASIRLRDGRLCYQLFMGNYSTKAAAEAEVKKLPVLFKEKGQPKIMQVSDITAQQ